MNKTIRYIIFILLVVGIAYTIYMMMNKPEVKVETTPAQTEVPAQEAPKVADDQTVQDGTEANDQVAQIEENTAVEDSSEAVVNEEAEQEPVVVEQKPEGKLEEKPLKR